MENLSDPHALYKELLYTCFEKIKKHLQKYHCDCNHLVYVAMSFLHNKKNLSSAIIKGQGRALKMKTVAEITNYQAQHK